MSLTYLIASLPFLQFGNPPTLQPEELLRIARDHLSPADWETLKDLLETGGQQAPHSFARQWRNLETQIRNAIASARAQRLKRPVEPYLKSVSGTLRLDIPTAVEEAFQTPSPLERERKLDRCRWRLLEEMAGPDPFTLEALFAYALRLRIAIRWANLQPETGEAVLNEQVQRILHPTALPRSSGTHI